MHTIWLREHNRVASALHYFHPYWNDEKLYQETRRIIIAEIQHITYKEWLPIILGNEFMRTNGLDTLEAGYSDSYFSEGITLEQWDPRVTNEFAAAAFRFGHSLIPSTFAVPYKRGGNNVSSFQLQSTFFKPTEFREDGENEGDRSKYVQ